MKDYTMQPRKPMMAGGMTTSADTAMRPMKKKRPTNPMMAQMAQGMMYGGKAKKK